MTDRTECTPQRHMIARYRLRLERETSERAQLPRSCQRPSEAAALLHRLVQDEPYEIMGALLLDTRREVIGYTIPYRGILDRALVEPRGILAPALLANAAAVILFHTHPSGETSPSTADIEITKRLIEAGEVLGITVQDHLILGEPPSFLSMFSEGHLTPQQKRKRRKAKPKYRHPKTGETWAGRGRMANWLKLELAAGGSVEAFRVQD